MSELPGPLRLTSTFPFVGRSAELEGLRALMPSGEEAGGRVVLLGGEPGSGKSRLVREFAAEAAARRRARALRLVRRGGAHPLRGRSSRRWTSWPGPPSPTSCGRRWVAAGVTSPGSCRTSALRVGELPPAAEADPDTERHRLHTAVVDLLAGITRQSPGAARARGRPLGRRSDPAPPAPARAGRERADAGARHVPGHRGRRAAETLSETLADLRRYDSIRLGLHGLSGDEVAEFVRSAAGEELGPALSALAEAIRELTDGNAFLVCELWRALEETGAVEVVDGTIRVTGSPAELGSPESVREVVSQRLSRLTPRHQRPARAGGHRGGGVRARRGAARRRPRGARAARGARRGRAQRDDRGVPGPRAGVPVHARAGAAGAVRPAVGAAASGAPPAGGGGAGGGLRGALRRGRWRTWRTTSPRPRPSAGRRAPWSTTCSPRGRPPRRWPTTRRRRGCARRSRWGSTARRSAWRSHSSSGRRATGPARRSTRWRRTGRRRTSPGSWVTRRAWRVRRSATRTPAGARG